MTRKMLTSQAITTDPGNGYCEKKRILKRTAMQIITTRMGVRGMIWFQTTSFT